MIRLVSRTPPFTTCKDLCGKCGGGPFFQRRSPSANRPTIDFSATKSILPSACQRGLSSIPAGSPWRPNWVSISPPTKRSGASAHPGHRAPQCHLSSKQKALKALTIDEPQAISTISRSPIRSACPRNPPIFSCKISRKRTNLSANGQVMIVSVVGTPNGASSSPTILSGPPCLPKKRGAKIIEANFSCPNVEKAEGISLQESRDVHEYAAKIAEAIHPMPLFIKVGVFPAPTDEKCLFAAARGGAQGICGLNSVSMQVLDKRASPSRTKTGKQRRLRRSDPKHALHFIRDAAEDHPRRQTRSRLYWVRRDHAPRTFRSFFQAGAQIAMTATGMMWDPYSFRT